MNQRVRTRRASDSVGALARSTMAPGGAAARGGVSRHRKKSSFGQPLRPQSRAARPFAVNARDPDWRPKAATAPPIRMWLAAERAAAPGAPRRPAKTRRDPAASAHPDRSATGRVHQVYGGIPQRTWSPLQTQRRQHFARRKWRCRGLIVNMSWRAGLPHRWGDHTDDITAGASAADPAAGCPGLRKRSSPSGAASGSADAEQLQPGGEGDRHHRRAAGLVRNWRASPSSSSLFAQAAPFQAVGVLDEHRQDARAFAGQARAGRSRPGVGEWRSRPRFPGRRGRP